ncbi:MAG: hypothetical protein K2O14_08300 [Oscillospiraceae bacterium]|nr:hypothetical protein [Oscillospiraceae bacterium]
MKKYLTFFMATVVLLTSVVLAGCSSKINIDLEQCTSVSFSGYEGEGRASASIDENYILPLLGDMNLMSAASIINSLQIAPIENNGTLSNGDKITVSVECNTEVLKNAKISVTNTELYFTVEGLTEKEKPDIFADVSLAVTGTSPFCKVSPEYSGDISSLRSYSFEIACVNGEEKEQYQNGDRVIVTLTDNALDNLRSDYIIEETSREYVVQADSAYILSPEDLDIQDTAKLNEVAQNNLDEQIENILNNKNSIGSAIIAKLTGYNSISVASSSAGITKIENVDFNSAYIGTAYEKSIFGSVTEKRYIYYFYDADISHNYKSQETIHCVLFLRFSDTALTADGITFSEVAVGVRTDFQTAYNEIITSDFSKLS